jgi:hypothetical protein
LTSKSRTKSRLRNGGIFPRLKAQISEVLTNLRLHFLTFGNNGFGLESGKRVTGALGCYQSVESDFFPEQEVFG